MMNSNYYNQLSQSTPYNPNTYYGENQNSMIQSSPNSPAMINHLESISDLSNEKVSRKRKISQTTPLEVFTKLREMGYEQERTIFVDRLQKLWEEHHLICRKLPKLSRQPIDLYRLYTLIRDQNGFEQFSKRAQTSHWREIASKLNISHTSTTPFHLKQKYIQLKLFHYECQYDREGIDPERILAGMTESPEFSFPLNSIESTSISNTKRKKLTSKDIRMSLSSIDSNKLLMSLRGGLLAETTWALDTLNILLTDDQTHSYFDLTQMPGLLPALVDIYLKCLTELFEEFQIEHEQISEKSKEEEDSIIYRIQPDCLNPYNQPKEITYEDVCDDQRHVLDLQNLNELSYIQTHFDPLRTDETDFHSITLFTCYSFGYEQISSRCICVSSILRNLSFLPGNDLEFVHNELIIQLLARLLSLKDDFHLNSLSDKKFFSSECLINIRENTLVTLANISSVLILDHFNADIINQLIDSLLHWSTYNSNEIPILSQRLSIEILTKLTIHQMNIDFILVTPPFSRIQSLLNILIDWLNVDNNHLTQSENYIQREFSIVLLHALIQCDSNLIIPNIKHLSYFISLLLKFFEDYLSQTSLTTDEMLIRTGNCLFNCRENVKIYEERILNLSLSNIIHPNIRRILTDILHHF